MLSALVMVSLLAGKLGDDAGFRGLRFGPDAVLSSPPLEGCTPGTADAVRWACPATIGDQSVTVLYMARSGFFTSVLINGAGFSSCDALKKVFIAAWGKPSQPNEYIQKFYWHDGAIWALFEYERVPDTCTLMLTNKEVQEQAEAVAREAASHGVQDL